MKLREKLKKLGQEQLFRFENELSNDQIYALEKQIEGLDFSYLDELDKKEEKSNAQITPIKAMTVSEIEGRKDYFEKIGIESLKKGEIGVVLVAGGMGTRLGSDAPKGVYNIGKTKDVYIFQRLFENTLEVVNKCGKTIPFFIMTSEKNHKATVDFLEEKNNLQNNGLYYLYDLEKVSKR